IPFVQRTSVIDRQLDPKRGTLAQPAALRKNAAALELHQVTSNRETKAKAAMRAGDPGIRLTEAFEDVREKLGWNTDARVADGDVDVRIPTRETHLDAAAPVGELHGVREQIPQNLQETFRIAGNGLRAGIRDDFELDALGVCRRTRR